MPERSTPADDWAAGGSRPPGPGAAQPGTGSGWGAAPGWGAAQSPGAPTPHGWGGSATTPRGPVGPPPTGPPTSGAQGGWNAEPPGGGPSSGWNSRSIGGATTTSAQGAGSPVGPPTLLLWIGLALPLLAVPLTLLGSLTGNVLGWLVAILGSVVPLALFTRQDLGRRLSRWYVDRPGLLAGLRIGVLVVGLAVAIWFAYRIADEVARWDVWF